MSEHVLRFWIECVLLSAFVFVPSLLPCIAKISNLLSSNFTSGPFTSWQKFSKATSLLNLLYTMTVGLTFDNFYNIHNFATGPSTFWQKFSKVSSLLDLLHTMTVEQTFENFYNSSSFASGPSASWQKFSKATLLLNLLHIITVGQTFENFYSFSSFALGLLPPDRHSRKPPCCWIYCIQLL